MNNQTDLRFLDIARLLSGEAEEIPFDLPVPDCADEESAITVSLLRFSGRVYDLSGFVRLSGIVTGAYLGACARCLAPVRESFTQEIDLPVTAEPDTSEEDVVVAEGKKIDLVLLAQETAFLVFPMRLLCKEDCKGLCPRCGKDLNDGECGCDRREIDPRLAGLADFFKD